MRAATDERRLYERRADAGQLLLRIQQRLTKAWDANDHDTIDRLWRAVERIERREQERDRG